ncbi:hypothetical protein DYU11_31115 [Fibrisoma montanum]|uniref:Uncharacterized protein n=1 Tax=Fibrisoma montanum TaxID=2305895 RepID=A0A418LWI3_9BACT|nr:hypothetical protein [Fibrisoma montanum]RIV17696.1 hypothetical protein DYU11_31115 [Fibrisoma montanum]
MPSFQSVATHTHVSTNDTFETVLNQSINCFTGVRQNALGVLYRYARYPHRIHQRYSAPLALPVLRQFRADTYWAMGGGVRTNPLLHSFSQVCARFAITLLEVDTFLAAKEGYLLALAKAQPDSLPPLDSSHRPLIRMLLRIILSPTALNDSLVATCQRLADCLQAINWLSSVLNARSILAEPLGRRQLELVLDSIRTELETLDLPVESLPAEVRSAIGVIGRHFVDKLDELEQLMACSACQIARRSCCRNGLTTSKSA